MLSIDIQWRGSGQFPNKRLCMSASWRTIVADLLVHIAALKFGLTRYRNATGIAAYQLKLETISLCGSAVVPVNWSPINGVRTPLKTALYPSGVPPAEGSDQLRTFRLQTPQIFQAQLSLPRLFPQQPQGPWKASFPHVAVIVTLQLLGWNHGRNKSQLTTAGGKTLWKRR